ncbi:MAG: AraC family transcriptional regulator ligand-binding domain-containing protein [Pseudomonadota bacterium]
MKIEIPASTHLQELGYPVFKIHSAVRVGKQFGLSRNVMLKGTGLDEDALSDTTTIVSLGQVASVYASFVENGLGTEAAFALGKALTPIQYGAFGVAIATATSMAGGFDTVFLYPELECPVVRMPLEFHEDMTHHIFKDNIQATGLHRFLIEVQTAMAVTFMETVNGAPFPIQEAWFTYDGADEKARYDALFGCPLRFGQPYNAFLFETRALKLPYVEANALINADMNDLCSRQSLRLRKNQLFASRVTALMTANLAASLTADAVSAQLGISERTLRRKLEDEGVTFKALLQQFRLRSAVHMIRNHRLAVDEIAHRLGYSAPSNFRSAFKSWTGLTVGEFSNLEEPLNRD